MSDPVALLPGRWLTRAGELDRYSSAAAEAHRQCAAELREAREAREREVLTLKEAARESGYAERTLRQKLSEGAIPNAGRKHAPRILRSDLPKRSRGKGNGWDASEHVRGIVQ